MRGMAGCVLALGVVLFVGAVATGQYSPAQRVAILDAKRLLTDFIMFAGRIRDNVGHTQDLRDLAADAALVAALIRNDLQDELEPT